MDFVVPARDAFSPRVKPFVTYNQLFAVSEDHHFAAFHWRRDVINLSRSAEDDSNPSLNGILTILQALKVELRSEVRCLMIAE